MGGAAGAVFFSVMEVFPTLMPCQARGEQRCLARQGMMKGLGEGGPSGWWEREASQEHQLL